MQGFRGAQGQNRTADTGIFSPRFVGEYGAIWLRSWHFRFAGRGDCERYVKDMGYIVELERGVWIAAWEGDQTIRKCTGFAMALGFERFEVESRGGRP